MGIKRAFTRKIERDGLKLIRHVEPVPPAAASDEVAKIYTEIRQGFGFLVPPMVLHAPVPALLTGVWLVARTVLLNGRMPQRYREAMSAAVSQANTCPFCVEVHSMALHAFGDHRSSAAIAADTPEHIQEAELRALVQWAGSTRQPQAAIIQQPPFKLDEAAEMIGLVVAFQYINRMVNVFLVESALPVPARYGRVQAWLKRFMGVWLVRDLLTNKGEPHEETDVPEDVGLPADMAWALLAPQIAGAFGDFAAVVETVGADVLSDAVRQMVRQQLALWEGEEMPLGQEWLVAPLAELEDMDRPAGRLALLTALASYRVDVAVIGDFQRVCPGDAALIKATAWAGLAAARRVGSWL